MPKHRKKKTVKTVPYNVSKKQSDQQQQEQSLEQGSQDSETLHCDRCSQSVEQIVQCEICDKWYCGPCENIPPHAMEVIGDYNQIHWFCQDCDAKVEQCGVQNLVEPREAQSTDNISNHTKVISSIVSDALSKVVGQFTEALKETKDYIKTSIEEIVGAPIPMEDAQHTTEQPATKSKVLSNGSDVVAAVDEYVEREKRKFNLVFHNIPESDSLSREQQVLKDTQTVDDLVNKEFNLQNIKIKRVTRLGSSPTRPRLLLVELEDISVRRSILRQAVKLRKSCTWSNIYISPDLTPKERQKNRLLRDELKIRRNAGEKNLYIKRGRIVSREAGAGSSAQSSQ